MRSARLTWRSAAGTSLISWARRAHAVDLTIIDGTGLAEQLADQDLFWIAERYLAVPNSLRPNGMASPEHSDGGSSQECPYRGLLSYEEGDAQFFYGRETRTADLIATLAGRSAAAGMLIVTGASGAGKSSLLRAGLLPAIGHGKLPLSGSAGWPRMVITPTRDPLGELAARLACLHDGANAAELRRELASHPETAHLLLRAAQLAAPGSHSGPDSWRLVLVVDQFEDLFTLCWQEHERHAYITALHALTANSAGDGAVPPALVVAGVRGDFLNRFGAHPELARAVEAGMFVVGAMTAADLTRVVTGPATAAALDIEQGLADVILADLRPAIAAEGDTYDIGALPLLSHAMLATWNNRDGNRLTIRGYGESGGVCRAVHDSAETIYTSLTRVQQEAARAMLSQLTAIAASGQITRRRFRWMSCWQQARAATRLKSPRFCAVSPLSGCSSLMPGRRRSPTTCCPRPGTGSGSGSMRTRRSFSPTSGSPTPPGTGPLTPTTARSSTAAHGWLRCAK